MKFIELTTVLGNKIMINVDCITSVMKTLFDEYEGPLKEPETIVNTTEEVSGWRIAEDYETVKELINKVG